MRKLELLAPARDAEVAMQAIVHGADAVYMGGPTHGARAAASNSIDDIARVVEFAHKFRARVYVTLNTLVYDSEIEAVENLVREYWRIGVDALIVQDMGLLRMHLPPIALHASTQCDIRSPQKAAFLAACGFSQLVLPREFSLEEIQAVRAAVPPSVELEAFVHGALCVSYSGDCQASYAANGRSANRGECAQMCRMAYDLIDGHGNVVLRDKHLLSLRDLCRLGSIKALADAGVSSFKIEGRLKDAAYVKTVVGAYRKEIDRVIAESAGAYCRSSLGDVRLDFNPDVNRAFNRGFTPYFLHASGDTKPSNPGSPSLSQQSHCGERQCLSHSSGGFKIQHDFTQPAPALKMANFATPKSIGQRVGEVKAVQGKCLICSLDVPLANGDGLGYFDSDGRFAGFRANRVEGNRVFPAKPVAVPPGTPLYRNSDARYDALMAQPTAQRLIPVAMRLRLGSAAAGSEAPSAEEGKACGSMFIALHISAEGAGGCEVRIDCEPDAARTPQLEPRRRVLSKLGGTVFTLGSLADDVAASVLIPASVLADLRRRAVDLLVATLAATYPRDLRRPERLPAAPSEGALKGEIQPCDGVDSGKQKDSCGKKDFCCKDKEVDVALWPGGPLTYHDNVANSLAERFYLDHGAVIAERAAETQPRAALAGRPVMTTRYCLRRELGACLRTPAGSRLPGPLTLRNKAASYRLDFDCAACRMRLLPL